MGFGRCCRTVVATSLHSARLSAIRWPSIAPGRSLSNGCGCSSGVEHNLAKVGVVGSNPIARSKIPKGIERLTIGPLARPFSFFAAGQNPVMTERHAEKQRQDRERKTEQRRAAGTSREANARRATGWGRPALGFPACAAAARQQMRARRQATGSPD